MPTFQRYTNLGAVVLPFVAFIVAIVLLWNKAVGAIDLAILLVMYLITGFGITVGYHRLLTHVPSRRANPSSTRSRSRARWLSRARPSRGSPTLAYLKPAPTRRANRPDATPS